VTTFILCVYFIWFVKWYAPWESKWLLIHICFLYDILNIEETQICVALKKL
jgi:hypothetical protein